MSDRVNTVLEARDDAVRQFYEDKKDDKHFKFLKELGDYIHKHPECYYKATQVMIENYIVARNWEVNLAKVQCRDTELCLSHFALYFEKNNSKKTQECFSYIKSRLGIWKNKAYTNWDWLFGKSENEKI